MTENSIVIKTATEILVFVFWAGIFKMNVKIMWKVGWQLAIHFLTKFILLFYRREIYQLFPEGRKNNQSEWKKLKIGR